MTRSVSAVGTGAGAGELFAERAGGYELSPDFILAAACCRWPPSPARDSAVRGAAAKIDDWRGFLDMVRRQRVAGLVYSALASAKVELPSATAATLTARMQRIVKRDVTLAAESARLRHLLEQAGIPALILKGAALAQLAYGAATVKQTRDIDILVPPECAEAALQIIEGEDYALVAPAAQLSAAQRRALIRYGREAELRRRGRRVPVELQWRAADNPTLLKGISARSPAQSVVLEDGTRLRTLAREDLFAYLCVHGAHHSWSRLKWLADLNAVIATDPADVTRLYRHAQLVGAGLCAAQALLLCKHLLALPMPAALVEEISATRRVRKLFALAMSAMVASPAKASMAGITRNVWAQFLLGQGWRFYFAQFQAIAVTPTDTTRWPLPPALHFLYPLLRLPLWLWRRGTIQARR